MINQPMKILKKSKTLKKINKVRDYKFRIEKEFFEEIKTKDINGKEISKNMISNMRNILKSIKISEESNSDLFYFLEDDYIHFEDAIRQK